MAINFDIKAPDNILSKLPFKRILLGVTLIVGSALFLPDSVLAKLFVLELRNTCGSFLGFAFIVVIALWLVIITNFIFRKMYSRWIYNDKNCRIRFEKISVDALKIIFMMYERSSHSMQLELCNATTTILESLEFIGRSNISVGGMYFDYYLQPWVVLYLNKHKEKYQKLLKKTH